MISQQKIEQIHVIVENIVSALVYLGEMRTPILGEVSTLGETLRDLYEELMIVHKEFVCFQSS